MNIIDLATKTLQLAIQTAITGVKSVVDAIKTTTDTTKTKVDAIDVKVGSLLDGRVVKSVQRGRTYLGNNPYMTVYISNVNPAKVLVVLNGGVSYGDFAPLYLSNITSNAFVVGVGFTNTYVSEMNSSFSWQVIEFY